MSSVERRKVLCSVTFHVVAITCVIWSLYVLIDRTTQEIQDGMYIGQHFNVAGRVRSKTHGIATYLNGSRIWLNIERR